MSDHSLQTVVQLLRHAAERGGDGVAIRDGSEVISWRELERRALAACRACIAAGLQAGDRASIWAPNIFEWIVAALGIQCAGAVLTPLNTRFKGAEAAWALRRSGARLLFTVQGFLDIDYLGMLADEELPELQRMILLRGAAGAGAQSWEDFLHSGEGVSEEELRARTDSVGAEDILDLLFTSGTTGHPKGVLSAHAQNLRVYDTWSSTVGLNADDRYLIINPFFHSFGYKAGWLASLIRGCQIVPLPSFDVDAVLECIHRERITMLPGPPTVFQSLLAHPRRGDYDLSSLRLAVTGAASVPVELVRRIRAELGFSSVLTAYGLTEATGTVSICHQDDSAETIAATSGCAMPGVELRCVDAQGAELPPGEPGELLVRGYNVMRGYFDDPEETARAIDSEGWLHTGDVAVMDKRGYIRITDRIKDMFITGGFNCYPAEIENALCSIPGVSQAAVVGMPDERLGEVACAFVVRLPDSALSEEEIIAWCRERLANYKVPRRVLFRDALPLNAAGKVLKTELRTALKDSGVPA